ncbi:hypothetical protein B0H63DRAFT_518666 [Podospora didyma]|uniref:ATPase AAA-type core domain-containing protein n=1 Tax=Podospora didyma TaxID=330526 RepID=A0AAE0U3Q1_9PEZI|nr:hypothetical protein B0H63DRAFT_518666 [Podospora didyma]
MRLPLEIRYKVYRLLLGRLFPGRHLHLHQSAVSDGVRFLIDDPPHSPGLMEVDYDLSVTGRPEDRIVDAPTTTPQVSSGPSDTLYRQDMLGVNEEDSEMEFSTGLGDCWIRKRPPSPGAWDSEPSEEDVSESSNSDVQDAPSDLYELHLHPVSVSIDRAMDPDPKCNPCWHELNADYLLDDGANGPLQEESDEDGGERYEGYDIDDCTCEYREPDDYQAVLNLSRVSRQFTAELGTVLWTNATIEILEPAVFGVLAQKRLVALRSVKSVVLHVSCFGDFSDTPVDAVREVCEFFLANTGGKLRTLSVVLSIMDFQSNGSGTGARTSAGTIINSRDLVHSYSSAAEARLEELGAVFRALEMAEGAGFHIRFGRGLSGIWPSWNDQGSRELRAVKERISGEIRDAWLPVCIRRRELRKKAWVDESTRNGGAVAFGNTQVHKSQKQTKAGTTWSADFIEGKGEGLTMLLHGKPGEGKTCTAVHVTGPLLSLTCSDIGVKPEEIEKELLKWLKPAENWGAIMLIEETDIYMEQRQYYKRILFVITNRVGTFGEAFMSRTHVQIHYPDFEDEERDRLWDTFFQKLEEDRETTMRIT